MNRFRTKKKAKDVGEGVVRASSDSDGPAVPTLKSSKTFRRGKKNQEPEPKFEIDLATALPSSDNFRTSALMSGLSARFSMLREQDDPKSKIGKASDDSVLFPKRQSRLNDFGFQSHGLSDIAEVSSINGSIRPPFAFGRTDSYHGTDGYGTDDDSVHAGSIMNRAKPGEGNNLFGGRQKIYKIPVSASGTSRSGGQGGGMGGRALYENDVSQSAFQKLREREREQERDQERGEQEEQEAQLSRPSSPPLSGYNRNRETSSTTSSNGPFNTRSSTAATSVTSQRTPSLNGSNTPLTATGPPSNSVPEKAAIKGRRLYETGLDHHLHEQQFSAMNRIDTLTRQRTLGAQTPPPGLSPVGYGNSTDRWDRQAIAGKASMPNLRAASPPPSGIPPGTFDLSLKQHHLPETKPFGMTSPPLSPPVSEYDEHVILPVHPNDRGKATALGAFSKPVQPYDENKYSQRQLQMQPGRDTPPSRKHSPPRAFASRQQQAVRTRADSNATFASDRSRSSSSAQRNFLPQDRGMEMSRNNMFAPENDFPEAGTFLHSPNISSDSQGPPSDVAGDPVKPKITRPLDLYMRYRQDQPLNPERPPESEHPANRQPASEGASDSDPSVSMSNPQPADSPTLGPTTGLSGMVRQHLRADSNASSVYGGEPSADFTSRFPLDASPVPQNEYATKNNPWETDDWDQDYYGNKDTEQNNLSRKGGDAHPQPFAVRSPNIDTAGRDSPKASWEKELESHHTRDGSSVTQKERDDFKNELANRRKRVQENLKSFVETESRSVSPLPGSEWTPKESHSARNNALGLLKPKSSRGSLIGRSQNGGQSKAMKMLGLGNATISSSPSPGKSDFDEDLWKEEEDEMLKGVTKPPTTPPQTRAFRQARRDAQRDRERQIALRHQQRAEADAADLERSNPPNQQRQRAPSIDRVPPNIRIEPRNPSREPRHPPVANSHRNGTGRESKESFGTTPSGSRPPSDSSRDRSSSDASGGRSKSRNGRYRDDLAKAMAEGLSSSNQAIYGDLDVPSTFLAPKSPAGSGIPSPMLSPAGRSRSNSRTGGAYYDNQNPGMLQSGGDTIGGNLSPRPSPTVPFVVNPTPALAPQPSPAGSGANTPTSQAFQTQGRNPAARKRSINKSDISEPRLISSTSRVTTVDLPPGASLQNGSGVNAPPIPAVNPRRHQARAMFGLGKKEETLELLSMPAATQSTDEMGIFSDEAGSKYKSPVKLRKSSSEGGNLNARARQAAIASPSPAVPDFPTGSGSPPRRPLEGGMF